MERDDGICGPRHKDVPTLENYLGELLGGLDRDAKPRDLRIR